jgi:hypothetical protein
MQQFITKHAKKINGTESCFDRVLFNGRRPLSDPGPAAAPPWYAGLVFRFIQGTVQTLTSRFDAPL